MKPKTHTEEDVPANQPGQQPVEPDEGQIPPAGIPADPEFERVLPPAD
jgi:hypothetical protein